MEPVVVQAAKGESLGAVAERAGIEIKYKCKKGECGTCEVNIGGKWVKTCQTSVTAPAEGDSLKVNVKTYLQATKKSAEFFSPMSFVEGVVNNGLGVVGFVQKGLQVRIFAFQIIFIFIQADDEFDSRMKREADLAARVEARKRSKHAGESQ